MNERLKSGLFCAKTPAIGKVECALSASAAFCRENVNSLSFPAPATGVDRLRGLCSIPHTSIWLALPQGPGIWRKKSAGCDPVSDSVWKSGGGAFAEARSGKLWLRWGRGGRVCVLSMQRWSRWLRAESLHPRAGGSGSWTSSSRSSSSGSGSSSRVG